MADGNTYDIMEEEDRFRFDVEKSVLGRKVTAIMVTQKSVRLALDDLQSIVFSVDGEGISIKITVPATAPAEPTSVM